MWLSCVGKFCSCAMTRVVSCCPHCRGQCSVPVHCRCSVPVHCQCSVPVHCRCSVPVHCRCSVLVHCQCSVPVHSVWQLLVHVQVILLGEIIPFIPSCLTAFFFCFIPFEHLCPFSLPINVSVLLFLFPFLPSCTLCYNNTVSVMQDVTVCACMIAQWNCPHGVRCIRMHNFPKACVLHECVQTVQIKVCPMLFVVSFVFDILVLICKMLWEYLTTSRFSLKLVV